MLWTSCNYGRGAASDSAGGSDGSGSEGSGVGGAVVAPASLRVAGKVPSPAAASSSGVASRNQIDTLSRTPPNTSDTGLHCADASEESAGTVAPTLAASVLHSLATMFLSVENTGAVASLDRLWVLRFSGVCVSTDVQEGPIIYTDGHTSTIGSTAGVRLRRAQTASVRSWRSSSSQKIASPSNVTYRSILACNSDKHPIQDHMCSRLLELPLQFFCTKITGSIGDMLNPRIEGPTAP